MTRFSFEGCEIEAESTRSARAGYYFSRHGLQPWPISTTIDF